MRPTTSDLQEWHRYFAVECNNRAWDLCGQVRTAEEDDEMLDNAHAAALHWRAVGTPLNHMRARTLLADVHALLGHGRSALAFATEMRAYFLAQETADWELALVHTVYAHAAYAAGEMESYRAAYAAATAALDAVVDPEDREIVRQTFDQVPAPA